MNKNIKLLLGFIYIICLAALLYVVFSYLDYRDLRDLRDLSFVKETSESLLEYKKNNFFLLIVLFFIFSSIWVFFLGFGSPIAIMSGYIFGSWYGTFISVLSFTFGSSFLYLFAQYFFSKIIKKKLSKKTKPYINFFKKNEFLYFMLFRFTGGAGIPFGIQNILPVIFNMKLKNYVYSTFIGLFPTVFIINSLGSGIENIITTDKSYSYLSIISNPHIYLPLLAFLLLLIISYFVKNRIFKN
jgi:uncharacterized membrane protein YdjX (TVP38/TMEM64 family)